MAHAAGKLNVWVQKLKCVVKALLLKCVGFVVTKAKSFEMGPLGSLLPPHGLIHRANLRMTNLPKSHTDPGPILLTMEAWYHHLPGLGHGPAAGCDHRKS